MTANWIKFDPEDEVPCGEGEGVGGQVCLCDVQPLQRLIEVWNVLNMRLL